MSFSRSTLVLALTLVVPPVHAIVFDGSAVGSWSNVVNGATFTITNGDAGGTADFEFGVAQPTTNLFTFNGKGSDGGAGWSGDVNTVFLVGDFSYRNGETASGTAFTGVDANGNSQGGVTLDIDLHIANPLALTQTFSFPFSITLTTNSTGDPVLDGDIVDILAGLTTTSFLFGGTAYTLELLGFSTDGGNTITTQFNSPENTTALAGVYAQITTATIPEPGSMVLVLCALGLAGLVLRCRPHISLHCPLCQYG